MAEILQLFSVTRRLYQPDALPLTRLQLESSVQRLRERYKVPNAAAAPGVHLLMAGGEFVPAGSSKHIPIQQIAFASNAVEVQVAGDTKAAEQLQQDLAQFLAEISDSPSSSFPEYAKSVQTLAIVKLEFSPEALFSDKLNRYMGATAALAFRLPDAEAHVQLGHLQWVVSYTRDATDYNYQPKPFTIEPRSGTRPSDRIFYTQSPTDSETHLRLIGQLEDSLR